MYTARGGGELPRVRFPCGRSVLRAAARCSARARQAERAWAFENLNPNPPWLSLGFPFSFGFFKCVSHFIEGDPLAI